MLEIGCGWGELSLRAARDFDARVLGITLSHEQLAGARERAADEGLSDAAPSPCRIIGTSTNNSTGSFRSK
jgi:cyclopropane fatty-acyl-phospholipid synthase-like methyltransferase